MNPPGRTVADLGERGLIRRIARWIDPPERGDVGLGDDAAVIHRARPPLLLTTDSLVEGTHFRRAWFRPEELGVKAMAVNLSDVAAMGGRPTHALVSLVLPPETRVAVVGGLFRGLRRASRAHRVRIVGGNVARGEAIAVTVTILGDLDGRTPFLRSGARPEDRIWVSGQPGLARLGLRLLESARPDEDAWDAGGEPRWRKSLAARSPWARRALRRFLCPEPCLDLSRSLRKHKPTAVIDVSDGLETDLERLAEAGRVTLVVDPSRLPVSRGFARFAESLGEDPLETMRLGGEDYELLVAIPPKSAARLRELPLTEIGEVRKGTGKVRGWGRGGSGAFEHFTTR